MGDIDVRFGRSRRVEGFLGCEDRARTTEAEEVGELLG